MKRCPQCAEKVKSAASVCRYCGSAFADQDQWGELNDIAGAGVRWIIGLIVALAVFYLAYALVSGAAADRMHESGQTSDP